MMSSILSRFFFSPLRFTFRVCIYGSDSSWNSSFFEHSISLALYVLTDTDIVEQLSLAEAETTCLSQSRVVRQLTVHAGTLAADHRFLRFIMAMI